MVDNFSLLQKYLELQTNVTLDGVIDIDYANLGYSKIEQSPYENFALVNKILSEEELSKIEEKFEELDRKPCVYFENNEELQSLIEILTAKNYTKDHEDSWMFHDGNNIVNDRFSSVKKVENESDLAIFLQTFDNSFQKDDPQNPFGTLGDYLKITESAWHKHHAEGRLEFFIAYEEDKPVATSTLNNYEGVGYISNVGSVREVRGKGFGKLVTLFAVSTSVKNGNNSHCLTTEEGTYPNEFYKRIGFVTEFTAVCYLKN